MEPPPAPARPARAADPASRGRAGARGAAAVCRPAARFVEALTSHGVEVRGSEGINEWVPVRDGTAAVARRRLLRPDQPPFPHRPAFPRPGAGAAGRAGTGVRRRLGHVVGPDRRARPVARSGAAGPHAARGRPGVATMVRPAQRWVAGGRASARACRASQASTLVCGSSNDLPSALSICPTRLRTVSLCTPSSCATRTREPWWFRNDCRVSSSSASTAPPRGPGTRRRRRRPARGR